MVTRKLFLIVSLLSAAAFAQNTYYVSFSTGSDSNTSTQAKSKATPWKNLKYMSSATSNASSYTVVAGDTFILMGCDVWPNASFPINWAANGTSGSHITIGVDNTWYNTTNCPSSWNRPKFDAGSAVMGGVECTGNNFFIRNVESTGYVDWNWIELVNFYNNNGSCYEKEGWIITASGTDHDTWNNFYIHAATAGASSVDIDNMITSPSTGNCANCLVNYAVIDNSDGTKYTSGGIRIPIQHSICAYVSNCIKPFTGGEYAYNNIYHIGAVISGVHANCIETIGATLALPYYIHDNLIHDINTGVESCEGLQVGNPNETDYVWNNLWYNMTNTGANGPQLPQNCSTGVTAFHAWNNTFGQVATGSAFRLAASCGSFGTFDIQNNHYTYGTTIINLAPTATTYTNNNNLGQSHATATLNTTPHFDQYSDTQSPYVDAPTSASNSTVGAGANLAGVWPGGFSTNDTTYACSEQTVGGVVESVCPQRTANARGATWDIGAYQFGTPQASAPTFSPSAPYSGGSTNVTISCATGPTACYANTNTVATDGATGCTSGTKYTAPIVTNVTTTYYAVCGGTSFTDSAVTGPEVYTISATGPDMKMSGLTVNGLTVTQ